MKRVTIGLVLGLLALAALFSRSLAGDNRNFSVHLSGANEVPPNNSLAQGQAIFHISSDGTSIDYKLIVSNIENVRAAHIHIAQPGVAGAIVVPLYTGPTIPGSFSGVLAEGTFTAANLTGPLQGQPLSALIESMNAGGAYVNAHTDQIPGGEIRGQLK